MISKKEEERWQGRYKEVCERVVNMIKKQRQINIQRYFEEEENLNQIQLMIGYSDNDFQKMFKQFIKWSPDDTTIQLILQDQTTLNWNPIIFAIFYWRTDILEWFFAQKDINMRNCLTAPFLI